MNAQKRTQFFYDHAGWSHPAGADKAGQEIAHQECARELARAEEIASSRGWSIVTEFDDDDSCDGDASAEIAVDIERGELVRLIVLLRDEDGQFIASLGSVIVASEDDPYIRVIGAELAAEELASHRQCFHGRTTCGNCGHAWCELCDPAPSALCHWCHGRGYSTAEMAAADEEMSR